MLDRWSEGRGILRKPSVCYSIVYCYNGAQRYKAVKGQLTVLGFDLTWLSSIVRALLCIFDLRGAVYIVNFLVASFSFLFSELCLVRLALNLVD